MKFKNNVLSVYLHLPCGSTIRDHEIVAGNTFCTAFTIHMEDF